MNACQALTAAEIRKQRLLREALLDVQALIPPGMETLGTPKDGPAREAPKGDATNTETGGQWNAGLRLDGVANIAVLCAGVAIVVVAAAADGLYVPLQAVLQA
jgi:hypothetical protein